MLDAPKSSRRRALLYGGVAAIVAVALAAWGIASRGVAEANLKSTTEQAAIPTVIVQVAQAGPAGEELVLPGAVRGRLETPIYARTSGYLKTWRADIGAKVKSGELLAVIDSPEVDEQLHASQADLKTAEANRAVAQSTADRVQGLVATQSVSRQEGEDRAAAALAATSGVASGQANVDRLRRLVSFEKVTAPYDGVITARETDVGNLINAGSGVGPELFRIADITRLRVYVQVPQSDAAEIKTGTTAELHFPEHPGKSYPATVVRTASALDPSSRTLQVELELDNARGELFPGSYAEVHFKLAAANRGVRLSGNTLLFRGEGLRVAIVGPDGKAQLRPIQLGRDFGATVEVLDGVKPSDRVILNPPAALDDGDAVRVAQPPAAKAKS